MSIDTRLRAGLQAEAELIQWTERVDLVDTWAEVQRRSQRETNGRRTRMAVAAVAAVAAIAVGLALLARPSDQVQPAPPNPTPSPTQTTDVAPAASPIEGKWVSDPVPVQRVLDHLDDEGFGEIAQAVLRGLRPDLADIGPDQSTGVQLILQNGQLVAGVSIDGDTANNVDFQDFEVRGEQVAFIQQDTECESLYAWSVTNDRLRLRLLDDPCADAAGVPDAAYQTALYTTVPFRLTS